MKRGAVILSICAVLVVGYFTASRWGIHHKTLTFNDVLRSDRPVSVDIAVRFDKELQAMSDMIELAGGKSSIMATRSSSPNILLLQIFLPSAVTMVVSIQQL